MYQEDLYLFFLRIFIIQTNKNNEAKHSLESNLKNPNEN